MAINRDALLGYGLGFDKTENVLANSIYCRHLSFIIPLSCHINFD